MNNEKWKMKNVGVVSLWTIVEIILVEDGFKPSFYVLKKNYTCMKWGKTLIFSLSIL